MGGSLSTPSQNIVVPTPDHNDVKKTINTITSVREVKMEEKPVEEKPVEEKPVEEKPVEEKPVEEKPVEEKPVEEKPVEEKPVEEKPVEEKPVKEEPVEEKAIQVFERSNQSSKIEVEPVNVSEHEDVVKKTKKNKKKNK